MADDTEDQSYPEQEQTQDGNVPPSITRVSFCCPHCGAFAHNEWFHLYGRQLGSAKAPTMLPVDTLFRAGGSTVHNSTNFGNFNVSQCISCQKYSVWVVDRLVYPPARTGPPPNNDLPDEVKTTYEEARAILSLSPRAAAAMLRVCIEMLVGHLKADGDTLDKQIGDLVKRGLQKSVQQALDAVRVIGNEAVHPGQMDLNDKPDTAEALFKLVNLIADRMISEEKEVAEIYKILPDGKREAIERRDKKPDPT